MKSDRLLRGLLVLTLVGVWGVFLSSCLNLRPLTQSAGNGQAWEYKDILRTRGFPGTSNAVTGGVAANDWDRWYEDGKPLPGPVDMFSKLRDVGTQGWELVAICPRSSFAAAWIAGSTSDETWVFKRRKSQL